MPEKPGLLVDELVFAWFLWPEISPILSYFLRALGLLSVPMVWGPPYNFEHPYINKFFYLEWP